MTKNIKNGFTLAEALIAMAIVGVIAAITIPTVVSETQNGKLAASLGRNVEAIETGCQLVVQRVSEASVTDRDGVVSGIWEVNNGVNGVASNNSNRLVNNNLFSDNTSEFFNTVPLTTTKKSEYVSLITNINGAGQTTFNYSSDGWHFAVSSKLGAYYGYNGFSSSNVELPIGYVYIDVNADKTPNRYGRDIFMFGLTDTCHMVPAGTSILHIMNSNIPIESDGCAGDNPSNGLSCTSRVVKNGYKIDY